MRTLLHLLLLSFLVAAGVAFGTVAARHHVSDRSTVLKVSSSRSLPALGSSPRAASADVPLAADEGQRRRAAARGALQSQSWSGVPSAETRIGESQGRLDSQVLKTGHDRRATRLDQPQLGREEPGASLNPQPVRTPRAAKGRAASAGVWQRQEVLAEPNPPPGAALRPAMRW